MTPRKRNAKNRGLNFPLFCILHSVLHGARRQAAGRHAVEKSSFVAPPLSWGGATKEPISLRHVFVFQVRADKRHLKNNSSAQEMVIFIVDARTAFLGFQSTHPVRGGTAKIYTF